MCSAASDSERLALDQRKRSLEDALKVGRVSEAICILKDLKVLKVTPELLKATKIGIVVNNIRKDNSQSEDLKQLAKSIVNNWKDLVTRKSTSSIAKKLQDLKESSQKCNEPPKTNSVTSAPDNLHVKCAKSNTECSKSNTECAKSNMECAGLNVKPTGLEIKSTGNALRDKCIKLIYDSLASGSCERSAHLLKLATEIEEYTAQEYSQSAYKNRIQTIRFNLRDKNNPTLGSSIKSGALSTQEFSKMSTQEMASQERKSCAEQAKRDAMNDSVAATDTQAETDMFRCSRCKMRKCKYSQMQTRSSDEPMTTFVTCTNCGKRWKGSYWLSAPTVRRNQPSGS